MRRGALARALILLHWPARERLRAADRAGGRRANAAALPTEPAAAEHAGTACNADARYSCSKRWHHQMRESRETWLGEALVGETVPEWKQDAVNVEEEHGP